MATGTGIAATGNAFIDNSSADVFIPEIWSPLAIVAREAQLVFAKLVDRKFEDNLTKGDKLNVPNISDLTARAKGENNAIEYEVLDETNNTITVDQHYYAAIAVESITKVQTDRDMLQAYAGKLGYALGLNIDDALASQVEADWSGQTVGTLAVENTFHDYLRAVQYLDDANCPADSRYFVISPASEVGLLKMDMYVNNDYTNLHGTGRDSALDKAYISSFLGIPVYKSVNVDGDNDVGHDNTLFQKEAQALIMQMSPTMHTMYDIDFFADKVAIEQLYGEQVMRADHGVWIKGA